MPDIDLKNIDKELFKGYSRHNEVLNIIIDLIKNGITSFNFKFDRLEKGVLISNTTFDFKFYFIENEIEKELFHINSRYSRKTLISFLEILQKIVENYDINLMNEFANDGYFYDKDKEEIVRYIYR